MSPFSCHWNGPAPTTTPPLRIDIATIVTMVDAIWAPMTAAVPNGMGPPKPDAHGHQRSA